MIYAIAALYVTFGLRFGWWIYFDAPCEVIE